MKNKFMPAMLLTMLVCGSVFGCAVKQKNLPQPPAAVLTNAEAAESALEVGAAIMDITPMESVNMAGFGQLRRSRSVHDPIEIRAVVLKKGDLKIALVSADILGFMKPDIDSSVKQITGFDGNDIVILGSSHNHEAPDTLGYWGGVKDEYMAQIKKAIVESVEKADAGAVPAKMFAGTGQIPDGAIKNVRQTDLIDLRVEVLKFVSEKDNATIAEIVNFACHPETLWDNHAISSDFVYVIRRDLQKEEGGTALFFNGALGAMVTPDVWRNDKYEEMHDFDEVERIGAIMLRGVREAIKSLEPVDPTPMRWARSEFVTPVESELLQKAARLGLFDREIYAPNCIFTQVAAVKIGSVVIASIPGEARPDIGLRVKTATGAPHPIFIGLGNDELGYILPLDGFSDPMYVYEPEMSTGKNSNLQIVEEVLKVVDMVK